MNSTPLISHEIPLNLFPYHDFVSDFPYLLAHLLISNTHYYNKEYADFYKKKLETSKFSMLNNSCYELGDAIDYKTLYQLGEEYKPSHLILPDCLNNKEITMERAMRYLIEYGKQSTPKFVGVIQGKTLENLFQMFYFYSTIDQIDIIAIPLYCLPKESLKETIKNFGGNNSYHKIIEQIYGEYTYKIQTSKKTSEKYEKTSKKYEKVQYDLLRIGIVKELMDNFNYILPKKIHLLDCLSPNEYQFYLEKELKNINSINTSAPIVYGWNNIEIQNFYDFDLIKPKEKIAENLYKGLSQKQLNLIAKNIKTIRNFF